MNKIKTAFSQSLRSLRANKARTLLTTLGIVIGIAAVILVLSAGAGFREYINGQIASLGSNTLVIITKVPPTTKNRAAKSTGPSFDATVAITSLKMRDLSDIKRLGNVTNAYGMAIGQGTASYRNAKKSILYIGTSAERFVIDGGTLKAGRFFTTGEDTGATQVTILGSKLADELFGQNEPVGQYVRLGNLNFWVIGVYNSRGNAQLDDSAFIPLQTAQKKMLGIDHIARGVVQIADLDKADITAEQIRAVLRKAHDISDPVKDDFAVQTQADLLGTLGVIFNGITALLVSIAAISLVVGGVGIMNIMYVAVTERTAEIGLKKALGATFTDIRNEFLIDSILVTILGGIVGILFGSLLSFLVSAIATHAGFVWPFTVPLYAILIGVGVSGTIGILFGVLPARSAAKLDPIEALRYE